MTKVRWTMCLVLLASGCVLASLSGPATAGKNDKGGKGKKLESKSEKAALATSVEFAKELELSFPGLTSLGARIEQARQLADPVGLANAGRELMVAEKVSGKHASLTAEDLLKEAVTLAKQRSDPAELKAVGLLAGKSKELAPLAELAEKAQAEAKKSREEGSKTRGIMGTLHADSRVATNISVYVDGRFVGSMGHFGDIFTYVGQTAGETTYLSARSSDGRSWSRSVSNAVGDFHWILYP